MRPRHRVEHGSIHSEVWVEDEGRAVVRSRDEETVLIDARAISSQALPPRLLIEQGQRTESQPPGFKAIVPHSSKHIVNGAAALHQAPRLPTRRFCMR